MNSADNNPIPPTVESVKGDNQASSVNASLAAGENKTDNKQAEDASLTNGDDRIEIGRGMAIALFSIIMFGIWVMSNMFIKIKSQNDNKYNPKKPRRILNITILVVYLVILIPMIISEDIAKIIGILIKLLIIFFPILIMAAIVIGIFVFTAIIIIDSVFDTNILLDDRSSY
jgi:hypothetical protein